MRLLLTGLILCLAHSADPTLTAEWRQARAAYYKGIQGDSIAYEQADQLFSRLYQEHPDIPLIEAYYGSLRLLKASHTWALWEKGSLSKQGIALMNCAVAAQPDNLEIRFLRAATFYHLPAFFHLRQQSKEDFAYLAKVAVQAARTGRLEPSLAAASLYFHGIFLEEAGKTKLAVDNWQRTIDVAPTSPAALGARKKLKELERE